MSQCLLGASIAHAIVVIRSLTFTPYLAIFFLGKKIKRGRKKWKKPLEETFIY